MNRGMQIHDPEYLTIAEAADFLRLDVQTLRNKISKGIFQRGVHFFKRERQIGVRFKRAALIAWLEEEGEEKKPAAVLQMAKGYSLGENR
jgi:hypothetical protein